MGNKRSSYKRRIGAKDRVKREALRILPTLCPAEHLQALAQLDQAVKNGQAKWPQEADTSDYTPQGTQTSKTATNRLRRANKGQYDPS